MSIQTNRRSVVRGIAWTTPVIALAAAAPAFAASFPPINISYIGATKCPGRSAQGNNNSFTYIFEFVADSVPAVGSVSASNVTVNGVVFAVKDVVESGTTIYVITVESENSADADGSGSITYTSGSPAVSKTVPFTYNGTRPDQELCRNI